MWLCSIESRENQSITIVNQISQKTVILLQLLMFLLKILHDFGFLKTKLPNGFAHPTITFWLLEKKKKKKKFLNINPVLIENSTTI